MKKCIYIILIFTFLQSCVEPFEAETQQFENALVIDARLTDEEKQHVVLLSRARPFEEGDFSAEQNAMVKITDNKGNIYEFNEVELGRYVSESTFSAQQNRSYQLSILTSDLRSYSSESVTTPESEEIENLYVERETNDIGEQGVSVYLDNTSVSIKYFRFEYEETYKIIAPNYEPFEFEVLYYVACDPSRFYEVGLKPIVDERRVCFASQKSVEIMQASTAQLSNNELSRFQIRFIDRENYIMSHRYSILIRQYAHNVDAHSYYEDLNNFSSSESVFSEIQSGFLAGNITSENTDENVLGYFEVASVDEQRLYFNYDDLFPDEPLPPYAFNCSNVGNPPIVSLGYHCHGPFECDGDCQSPLIEAVRAETIVFHSENENPTAEVPGPYFTLPSPCGDCTKLGSNAVPDFWTED